MIRPPRATDQGYIAATWARSMLSGHAAQRHMASRSGMQIGEQITKVMDRSDSRALIFAAPDDADIIHGWVVYVADAGVPIVHYLYVRARDAAGQPLRGKGIATELLSALGVCRDRGVVCTSHGPSSDEMRRRYQASVHMPLGEFLRP